ncbi:MAG: hypothetical protein WCK89_04785 [bacterium]
MRNLCALTLCATTLALSGCTTFSRRTSVTSIPCTYRFKSLSRPEDQARVEAAIHSVAVSPVVKAGTIAYPEYRFRVARMADLDTLHPKLIYSNPATPLASNLKQTLNVQSAGVDMTFDSTDVSGSMTATITFNIKPGSRLYYKHPGGVETDITAKVGKTGKVSFPTPIKEGQKFIYARAMKDRVTRYIRINLFTNEVQDITQREY